MRDCENVEVREALPDLIHDRLPAAERERVLAHVRGCADCAAELELLRGASAAVRASAPAVDAAAVARAVQGRLAAPAAPVERSSGPRRPARGPLLGDWRLRTAAAVVLMAGGAAGVLVARGGRDVPTPPVSDTVVAVRPAAPAAAPVPAVPTLAESAPAPQPAPRAVAKPAPAVALGSSFSDLSDDELAAIIQAVTGKDAKLPVADPGAAAELVGVEGTQ